MLRRVPGDGWNLVSVVAQREHRLVVVSRQIPQPDCRVGGSTREHVTPVVKRRKI